MKKNLILIVLGLLALVGLLFSFTELNFMSNIPVGKCTIGDGCEFTDTATYSPDDPQPPNPPPCTDCGFCGNFKFTQPIFGDNYCGISLGVIALIVMLIIVGRRK